jgi:hypothetical protein
LFKEGLLFLIDVSQYELLTEAKAQYEKASHICWKYINDNAPWQIAGPFKNFRNIKEQYRESCRSGKFSSAMFSETKKTITCMLKWDSFLRFLERDIRIDEETFFV